MEKNDENQQDLFTPASEIETPELQLETINFQSFFQWMVSQAEDHRPENYSFSVKASRARISGEINYTAPVMRYSRRQAPKPKPLNLLGAQGVVAEYPDLLKQAEETDAFWFIGTKKKLDDKYQEINGKMRENGFVYERWNQSAPHTGGWRGKK